jgi:DNA-binding FadR family transcriptional regulator
MRARDAKTVPNPPFVFATDTGRNLTQSIVHDLGRQVVTRVFTADNPFPAEGELCRRYGVSRPVLREAVKMLTAKGLLSSRPRQGTSVQAEGRWNLLDPDVLGWLLERKFDNSLLIEFTQLRLAIEPEAAALAAVAADLRQQGDLRRAVARMEAAERGEDDPLLSDIAFHVAILHASGNRFFAQLDEFVETALRFSIRRTNLTKGVRLASVADHRRVAEAILGGDVEASRILHRALIQGALDLLVANNRVAND